MSYDRHLQMRNHESTLLSVPCIALCIMLLFILGYLPKIPSNISQLFRPVMIALCFVFPSAYLYRLSLTSRALILYLLYFLTVFLINPITNSSTMAYGAVLLFGAFFILLTMRPWNRREIQTILFSIALAGTVFAIILYIDNPDLLHVRAYGGLLYREAPVNDNSAGFIIVPGHLCSLALLLFHKPQAVSDPGWRLVVRLVLLLSAGFTMYVLFCIGARSAFFSAVAGSVCILLQKARTYHSSSLRWRARIVTVLLLLILLLFGMQFSEGTHSARLFSSEDITDLNGREDLAAQAWPMIHKKPVFGGGYDYWTQEGGSDLGTHNTFLTIMVRGGYVGALMLSLFLISFLYEALLTKSLLLLSFSIEAIFHTLTESDLDYFAYIPLLIVFILLHYAKAHNCPPESVL